MLQSNYFKIPNIHYWNFWRIQFHRSLSNNQLHSILSSATLWFGRTLTSFAHLYRFQCKSWKTLCYFVQLPFKNHIFTKGTPARIKRLHQMSPSKHTLRILSIRDYPPPLYKPTSRRNQSLRIAQIRNIVFDRLIWPSECVGCVQVYFMWKSYFSKTVPSPSSFLWWRRAGDVRHMRIRCHRGRTDRRNRTRFACEHFELKQRSVLATSKATQTSLMSTTQQIWAPKICPDFDGSTLTAKNNLKSTKLSGIIWLQKY